MRFMASNQNLNVIQSSTTTIYQSNDLLHRVLSITLRSLLYQVQRTSLGPERVSQT